MRLEKLDPPIDLDHDHVLGPPDAELTLVEYGSYASLGGIVLPAIIYAAIAPSAVRFD